MGIDSMRVGGGRCPPLLVGGLLVACLMLICNWWTLSSENIELVRQIDELNEQLKIRYCYKIIFYLYKLIYYIFYIITSVTFKNYLFIKNIATLYNSR